MNEKYIFVQSDNGKDNFFDFRVVLPSEIDLTKGKWELGLAEAYFKSDEEINGMYVSCDVITTSFFGNNSSQILRFLPSCKKGHNIYRFDNIFYFEIIPCMLRKLRISINTTGNKKNESLANESFYCTLHIRQVKE